MTEEQAYMRHLIDGLNLKIKLQEEKIERLSDLLRTIMDSHAPVVTFRGPIKKALNDE
jgi:hypothetical protein